MVLGREISQSKPVSQNKSKPVSHTAAKKSKLFGYTDSSNEEEDLHVDVNFDETINLAIN